MKEQNVSIKASTTQISKVPGQFWRLFFSMKFRSNSTDINGTGWYTILITWGMGPDLYTQTFFFPLS